MVPAAKQRILFVDDEPAILTGLQHLLYKERRRWDIVFASNAEHALAELRKGAFAVVVSDMRMPGMDGAELLARIKGEFPATVRVMLSGQADRDSIVRALPALHQLLSKPCDAATLRAVLERSTSLAALPCEERVKDVIGGLAALPSPPALFYELTAALDAPSSKVSELSGIVERDPAMCAKVLQLINSSYFSLERPTLSIADAVAFLGIERLRYIVLTASIFAPLDHDPVEGVSLPSLQQASLACAQTAERLATDDADRAFVAALLHDIGRVVLAVGLPSAYAEVTRRCAGGEPLRTAELEVFGVSHEQVGAVLLQIWGLPADICDAVRCHHDPVSAAPSVRPLAGVVHVADAYTEDHGRGSVDFASLEAAGLAESGRQWCAIAEAP